MNNISTNNILKIQNSKEETNSKLNNVILCNVVY